MSHDKKLTEARLHEALQRLLNSEPKRVKRKGRLTLNKINNEAGLGNSYVHKFPGFVAYAKPIIEEYNNRAQREVEDGYTVSNTDLNEVDKLRADVKREQRLKMKYKQERDDARREKKELEAINNTLMFRLYELQEELGRQEGYKVVPLRS